MYALSWQVAAVTRTSDGEGDMLAVIEPKPPLIVGRIQG